MFSRFYFFLKDRAAKIETRLAETISQDLTSPYQTKIFSFRLMFDGLFLFLINVVADFFKFFIIMFSDSGEGFNVLFKQKELTSCPYSYHNYKLIRQKIRTFSFSTLATLIIATGISTLVLNLWLGGSLPSWAATFSWSQSSWQGGASTTAIANTTDINWDKFYSKDANIATTSEGKITLIASSALAIRDDLDADFNGGTVGSNIYVSGGSLKLSKPIGASCTTNADCLGGANAGNCYLNVCRPIWLAGVCTSTSGGVLEVHSRLSTLTQWSIANTDCLSPQCGLTNSYPDYLVSPQLFPEVDFTAYPAQNACKQIGGRLPSEAEAFCIASNPSFYNMYGFSASQMSTNQEVSASTFRIRGLTPVNTNKNSTIWHSCVRGD